MAFPQWRLVYRVNSTTLAGKVALVTGGSSGIGRAAAIAFARAGARVAIASRRVDESEQSVRLAREAGGEARFFQTDVTDGEQIQALVASTVATWGRLDYAFNNAGMNSHLTRTAECKEETWHQMISVNLTGVWLSMKYEIRQMLRQGGGVIVNNASTAGLVGMRGSAAYSAAKGGVIQLTRTAALEYARSGIRINAVCPGFIQTPILEPHMAENPDLEEWMRNVEPMGRLGKPEEVAAAVVWLCSDSASFITGHPLVIDGGLIAS
jgi:NAD(P)-dependent dehydrogenase (short-subunit alcohol dehydrogenase family)